MHIHTNYQRSDVAPCRSKITSPATYHYAIYADDMWQDYVQSPKYNYDADHLNKDASSSHRYITASRSRRHRGFLIDASPHVSSRRHTETLLHVLDVQLHTLLGCKSPKLLWSLLAFIPPLFSPHIAPALQESNRNANWLTHEIVWLCIGIEEDLLLVQEEHMCSCARGKLSPLIDS